MLVLDGANLDGTSANLLMIIDEQSRDALASELETYEQDLEQEGISLEVLPWDGGPSDLRATLKQYNDGTWSAFFVGDVPWILYEQDILEGHEEFPTDIYFSALDTEWEDRNGNGVYDAHSAVTISLPVSRIMGTAEELAFYFQKNHAYRNGSLTFQDRALLFKDDDWSDYQEGSDFGMKNIVSDITSLENLSDSRRLNYTEEVAGGYRYIYQWIHAVPYSLYIQEEDQFRPFTVDNIQKNTIACGFYNLFDCKGTRFSEKNIGMTYLTATEGGLAVHGSTKVGGNFEPLEFHRSLAAGLDWGNSYKNWYNQTGTRDDSWYLGMIILGDPTLRIVDDSAKKRGLKEGVPVSDLVPPNEEKKREALSNLLNFENFAEQ